MIIASRKSKLAQIQTDIVIDIIKKNYKFRFAIGDANVV